MRSCARPRSSRPDQQDRQAAFQYVGEPSEEARECGSRAATEVIADFPAPWGIEEEHFARPLPAKCEPLEHLAYLRFEGGDEP